MSIFNFRRGGPDKATAKKGARTKAAPESVEVVRRRARQRLIGSAVLVLLGVVGFPLLFETQPRPVPVDIPIEIPSRSAVKPASPIQPVSRSDSASVSSGAAAPAALPVEPGTAVAAQASLHDKEEIVEPRSGAATPSASLPAPVSPPPAAKAELKPQTKPEPRHEAKPEAKPKPKAEDGQRAKALLDGTASTGESRLVVQVGAFSDANKARDARAKLEKAGLKTYTQVVETKDGQRIRVRVGPYATKAEVDKAAARIKSLDLPATVLSL